MELKYVIFALKQQWEEQIQELAAGLQEENIVCCSMDESGKWMNGAVDNSEKAAEKESGFIQEICNQAILLTDDREIAAKYAGNITIIGCERNGAAYFDGAVLVTDDLTSLDARFLEETMLHALGRPVVAALTERLIIREMTVDDWEILYSISRQNGMEHVFAMDSEGGNCFERERLTAYISQVYRFYGYGLWSVWKKDGTLIGCCGLSEYEAENEPSAAKEAEKENENEPSAAKEALKKITNSEPRLELQYMLSRQFQGQGYGLEMCRAVLGYAFARTDWQEVWVRVHPDNAPSRRLAERLGFERTDECTAEMLVYRLDFRRQI